MVMELVKSIFLIIFALQLRKTILKKIEIQSEIKSETSKNSRPSVVRSSPPDGTVGKVAGSDRKLKY
jgi:hypothetical protein